MHFTAPVMGMSQSPPLIRADFREEGAENGHKHKALSGHPSHQSSQPGTRTKRFMFLAFRG